MAGVGPGQAWPRLEDVNQKFASGKPSRKQHEIIWNYHDLDVPGVPNHPATSTFQGQSCQSCQSWRFWQLPCSRFSCDRWRVLLLTAKKVGNEESKDWVESMKSEWCDIIIIIIIIIIWYAQYDMLINLSPSARMNLTTGYTRHWERGLRLQERHGQSTSSSSTG